MSFISESKRLEYGNFPLAIGYQTPWAQSNFINLTYRKAADIRKNYSHYASCFWNIREEGTGWHVDGVRFATIADAYDFIRNFVQQNGGAFANNVIATIYDSIDHRNTEINKIYGMNTFYSMLKGRKNYKNPSVARLNFPSISWSKFSLWFQDLCNQGMGFPSGYTWNASDNAERAIWLPRNQYKLYGLPAFGFSSGVRSPYLGKKAWNLSTLTWDDITPSVTFVNGPSGNHHLFCMYDNNSDNYFFDGSSLAAMGGLLNPTYSVAVLYRLFSGDHVSLLLKPIGVDRLGLNWFDRTNYDLYTVSMNKDRSPIRRLVSSSNISFESAVDDLLWVKKAGWIPIESNPTRFTPNQSPGVSVVRFIVQHKDNGSISKLSRNYLMPQQGQRDATIKWEVKG